MPCDAERVTAYVDGELDPWRERRVERHLAACPACATQAVLEIELRESLRTLAAPRAREGFAAELLGAVLRERAAAATGC